MIKRERYKISASVFVLLTNKSKILLIKRSNTGWMDGFYSIPAGAIDGNESFKMAAIREVKEEVNATIMQEDMRFIHLMHNFTHKEEWTGVFFIANNWSGDIKINEPDKHSEIVWVSIHRLPEKVVPYVKQAIQMYQKQVGYSEFGWDDNR